MFKKKITAKKIVLTHANNIALEKAKAAMKAYKIKNQNYFGVLFEAGKKAANRHKDNYYEANKATSRMVDKMAKEIYSQQK